MTDEEKNAIIKLWVDYDEDGYYSGLINARKVLNNNKFSLEFKTKQHIYLNGNTEIPYYTDVAVRANPDIQDISELNSIVLLATVVSDASVDYKDVRYSLRNINFSQCLPLAFRTNRDYSISGTTIYYYDDKGDLIAGSPARYSLIGHDILDLINYAPEPTETKESLVEYEQEIKRLLTDLAESLNRPDLNIMPSLSTRSILDLDEFNVLLNYKELTDDLSEKIATLDEALFNINDRLSIFEMGADITTYDLEPILYIDTMLNELRTYWRNDCNLLRDNFGANFTNGNTVLSNSEEVLRNIQNYRDSATEAYNQAIDAYNASAQTDEDKLNLAVAEDVYNEANELVTTGLNAESN